MARKIILLALLILCLIVSGCATEVATEPEEQIETPVEAEPEEEVVNVELTPKTGAVETQGTEEDFQNCRMAYGTLHGIAQNQCIKDNKIYVKDTNKIIDMEWCGMYYDGCNDCLVQEGQLGGCTRKYCKPELMDEPMCKTELSELEGTVVSIDRETAQITFGDQTEKVMLARQFEKVRPNYYVKVKFTDNGLIKTAYNLEVDLDRIEVVDFDSCQLVGEETADALRRCTYEGQTYTEDLEVSEMCERFRGTWLEDTKECERVSEENCDEMGGTFNECASACRNNEENRLCTMQCVLVCEFE